MTGNDLIARIGAGTHWLTESMAATIDGVVTVLPTGTSTKGNVTRKVHPDTGHRAYCLNLGNGDTAWVHDDSARTAVIFSMSDYGMSDHKATRYGVSVRRSVLDDGTESLGLITSPCVKNGWRGHQAIGPWTPECYQGVKGLSKKGEPQSSRREAALALLERFDAIQAVKAERKAAKKASARR